MLLALGGFLRLNKVQSPISTQTQNGPKYRRHNRGMQLVDFHGSVIGRLVAQGHDRKGTMLASATMSEREKERESPDDGKAGIPEGTKCSEVKHGLLRYANSTLRN